MSYKANNVFMNAFYGYLQALSYAKRPAVGFLRLNVLGAKLVKLIFSWAFQFTTKLVDGA